MKQFALDATMTLTRTSPTADWMLVGFRLDDTLAGTRVVDATKVCFHGTGVLHQVT